MNRRSQGGLMALLKWILIPVLLISCSETHQRTEELDANKINRLQNELRDALVVIDTNGQPVADASVLIGYEKDKEFSGNILTTDDAGTVALPEKWSTPLPVTIFKEGYINLTHLDIEPKGHIFQIKKTPQAPSLSASGTVQSFTDIKKDGMIDFGLVIPSFSREGLLNLDLSKMISPELEKISVLGFEFQVPSNIFLPKQSENYGFIPFTIEKALFKIFFDFPGKYPVTANRGRFDFKKVSDKLKNGKSYFEVVNDFQFTGVGLHNLEIEDQAGTPVQLPSATALSAKIELNAPVTPSQNRMIYGIATLLEQSSYSILDIKLKDSTRQFLAFPQNAEPYILLADSGYEKINEEVGKISESMSTALYKAADLQQAVLLQTIEKPQALVNGVKSQTPHLKPGLLAHSTRILLSNIEAQSTDSFYVERKSTQWEIYSNKWITEVQLPNIENRDKTTFKRWDVIYFATQEGETHATHMVRNAVDFN